MVYKKQAVVSQPRNNHKIEVVHVQLRNHPKPPKLIRPKSNSVSLDLEGAESEHYEETAKCLFIYIEGMTKYWPTTI